MSNLILPQLIFPKRFNSMEFSTAEPEEGPPVPPAGGARKKGAPKSD